MAATKFHAYSCPHSPITHQGAWKWNLEQIEEFKPKVIICLGDQYEALASSRHSRHTLQKWSLYDEHRAFLAQAKQLREAAPDAKKVWLYGNHDDNQFGQQPDRIPEDLREAADWRNYEPLRKELEDWRIIDAYSHRTTWHLGQITFQHGCAVTATAAKDAAYLYGVPNGLYISGHTHQPVRVTQCRERKTPLPYWYANPGTLIDFEKCYYMARNSMAFWGRGIVRGEVMTAGEGREWKAKRNWDAETLIHSMAHPGVTL